ncbi:mechanosensitive ion channel domain-containing protein [Corynebacterium sp. 70RC1]|uniref:mechanosensitive ion channel family protein n=2 Tax=Corynebacterium TaxID=1716 RepID=UPI00211CC101
MRVDARRRASDRRLTAPQHFGAQAVTIELMPFTYILSRTWTWFLETGINLVLLILLAFLVPRVGRLAMRLVERQVADENEDESKAHLAFAGVAIYIAQMIAYFLVFVFMLQQLGFSLAGAAIPATAASAAIGLGAQSIIADFLAGFFVLSEKQYGVGDWVRFEGGATTVEGTVIQITMRATRIRTLAEETVIIPNSKAGVSINNSNYWSSAVIKMPIPLLGSSSIHEAIDRATAATRQALTREDIAPNILGELKVHESVAVNPPTTVGMPWTVDLRFVVQVRPGTQWSVERAVRTSIIEEFWQEYGSAPTLDGTVTSTLHTAAISDAPAVAPHSESGEGSAAGTQGIQGNVSTQALPAATLSTTTATAGTSADDGAERFRNTPDAQDPNRGEFAEKDPATTNELDFQDDDAQPGGHKERDDEVLTGWRSKITLGGRMRVSTAFLLLGLFTVVLLKGFSVDTGDEWDGNSGWLAPQRTPAATSELPTTTPEAVVEAPSSSPATDPQTPTPTPTADTPLNQNSSAPAQTPADQAPTAESEPTPDVSGAPVPTANPGAAPSAAVAP